MRRGARSITAANAGGTFLGLHLLLLFLSAWPWPCGATREDGELSQEALRASHGLDQSSGGREALSRTSRSWVHLARVKLAHLFAQKEEAPEEEASGTSSDGAQEARARARRASKPEEEEGEQEEEEEEEEDEDSSEALAPSRAQDARVDSEGRLTDLGEAQGGPYSAGCAVPDSLPQQEACTLDGALVKAWTVALALDCQLFKAQNLLDVLAGEMHEPDAGPSVGSRPGLMRRDTLKCPESCERCAGQRYWEAPDGKVLLLLPQPLATGTAYAYAGSARVLGSEKEIEHVEEDRIERALLYATRVPALGAVSDRDKYSFLPGVQHRLWYRGNDPAVLVDLTAPPAAPGEGARVCAGVENRNLIDPANFEEAFNSSRLDRGAPRAAHPEPRPYWSLPVRDSGTGSYLDAVSKVVFDASHAPTGTLSLEMNMTALAVTVLDTLAITPNVYAAIVDRRGHIVAMSQKGRDHLFFEGMSEAQMRDSQCGSSLASRGPPVCDSKWFQGAPAGGAPEGTSPRGGANLTAVLEKMFLRGDNLCAMGVRKTFATFGTDKDSGARHTLAHCRFGSVPAWGLIVGFPMSDLVGAASMALDRSFVKLSEVLEDRKPGVFETARSRELTLSNRGRFRLPYVVDVPTDAFMEVRPRSGTLAPGQSVALNVTLHLAGLGFGKHTGWVHVRSNLGMTHGMCFRSGARAKVELRITKVKQQTLLQVFINTYNAIFFWGFVVLTVVILGFVAQDAFWRRWRRMIEEYEQIDTALAGISNLPHPMVLIKAATFKSAGRLLSHEEAQEAHKIIWLYSLEEVTTFNQEKRIVFISHQWTAFNSPDPTNTQFKAMVMSIDALCRREEWDEDSVHVWVDYTSIPQKHRGLQTLAINSLTVYAAQVAAFVIVAPPVEHHDLKEVCDKESYQKRCWCRAEQLSHRLAVGSKNMYLAESSGKLTPLTDAWLEMAMCIFDGELTCCKRNHAGMTRCDKELLVTPVLGLWAQLCRKCEDPQWVELHEFMSERIDEVFPHSFKYKTDSGEKQKKLFGKMAEIVPTLVQQESEKRRRRRSSILDAFYPEEDVDDDARM